MKGSRFSEEQIIGILREHEAGARTEEVRRRRGHGVRWDLHFLKRDHAKACHHCCYRGTLQNTHLTGSQWHQ